MADDVLNVDLLFRMIAHWASTDPNAYYGSSYGAPGADMLQKPLSAPIADYYLAKMRQDIPVIAALPSDTINMHTTNDGLDRKSIFIEINGRMVSLGDLGEVKRGSY